MKVILKKDMSSLGGYGEVVTAARGYARNYLIPRGMAIEATPGNLRQLDSERAAYVKKVAARVADAEKLASELEAVSLSFERKAGEDDKLFGSVTTHDIEEALKSKGFASIDRKAISLKEPIKTIGSHAVAVKLHPEVSANIKIEVLVEAVEE
jgi:large subunit ribosomal protein L9